MGLTRVWKRSQALIRTDFYHIQHKNIPTEHLAASSCSCIHPVISVSAGKVRFLTMQKLYTLCDIVTQTKMASFA